LQPDWTKKRGAPHLKAPPEADEGLVALINSHTAASADRFLYSATEDIVWMKPDGSIGHGRELLSTLKRRRSAGRSGYGS
jgi:hypothetical protein